jgi:hypothetical protein
VGSKFAAELLIQLISDLGSSRADEAWPTPLAHIAIQGELGNGEHGGTDIAGREIHLPLGIFEDPERRDLVGEFVDVLPAVVTTHADQNDEAAPDAAYLLGPNRDGP